MSNETVTPLLVLKASSTHYGNKQVLQAINFRIHKGERIVVLGKSGAGKSTLLKVIQDKLTENNETFSLIPQQHGLVENLSVFHNIFMGRIDQQGRWANILNLIWPQRIPKENIQQLIQQLELHGQLFTPVASLSGGQQQRVAIGRAMYRESELLLADEPTTSLDKPMARRVLELLSRRYKGFVLTTHDTDLALTYADRIIGINAGRIVIDQPAKLLSKDKLQPLYDAHKTD